MNSSLNSRASTVYASPLTALATSKIYLWAHYFYPAGKELSFQHLLSQVASLAPCLFYQHVHNGIFNVVYPKAFLIMRFYENSNPVLLDLTEKNRNPLLLCHSYFYMPLTEIYPFNPERCLVVWTATMEFILILKSLLSHTIIPDNPVNFPVYTSII